MKITFLGVGEACDPQRPNTSILVDAEDDARNQLLLDCGFTTPHQYFGMISDPELLDALWISHFHGDHFFGVPLLLLRFWEMQRLKPLIITGITGIQKKICHVMELAYPGFINKIQYHLHFVELEPGATIELAGFSWDTAVNEHSQTDLALCLKRNGKSVYYSGDGRPLPAGAELAHGCDLLIHEAYRIRGETPGHGSVQATIEFAKQVGARRLALVHLSHDELARNDALLRQLIENVKDISVLLPNSGFTLEI